MDFFFQLNLLPPYSLCSQGDNFTKFLLKDEISFVGSNGHINGGKTFASRARMSLNGCPDCVLQHFRDNVIERHFDVRKPGTDVTGNADIRCVSVLVHGQVLDKGGPPFDQAFGAHGDVDDADVIILEQDTTFCKIGKMLLRNKPRFSSKINLQK